VTHVFAEGPNSHEISATAADEDGTYAAAQTVNVNVTHLPVELQDLAVTPSIDENGIATLTGNIINPDPQDSFTLLVDWGDGSSLQAFSYAAGITAFSETHRYLDDPAGIGSDKFIVTATLADDDGGSDTATAEVMVNNVAPVITSVVSSAPNIGDAAEQQLVTIAGTFGDIGTLDTHVAVINWGDGTTSEAIITESNGSGSISGTHQYADGGIYEVSVALSDDDAGAVTGSATAAIAGVGVKDGVLFIIGTHGDDHLLINRDSEGIKIHADFLPDYGHIRTVAPDGIQRVEVLLGDGTDHATIAGDIGISILMDGGAGDDHLKGGLGADVLRGGAGDDVLIGGGGNDTLDGGEGHDILLGGDGEDILLGGAGNDILVGGSGNDHLDGGAGNDMLLGGSGNDSLIGGDGEDLTVGGAGNDVIDGGAANDVLSGGSGEDSLYGGEGNDVLFGGSNDDSLAGGEENDILSGGSGDDTLEGDAGNDVLLGDAGEDALTGGDGNDILIGGAGNDTLAGGAGTNILIENSPSWVRQFVTNLASYGLDPNGDISIEISAALDPQLPCA
jgi:Ca2+-binding RTX toxin-like protein